MTSVHADLALPGAKVKDMRRLGEERVVNGGNRTSIGIERGDLYLDLSERAGVRVERRSATAAEFHPRRDTIRPSPRPPLGRSTQIDAAFRAMHAQEPIEFYAPCGFGKSALLHQIAAEAGARRGVPGVHLVVGGDPPADLVQRLIRALFGTRHPVMPSADRCAQLLAAAKPVVVLDDVGYRPDQLTTLFQLLPGCGAVIGSEHPALGRLGRSELLPGLTDGAAFALASQDLGRRPTNADAPAVHRLIAAVDGQPLRLRQAVALVRAGEQSFAALADLAERDPSRVSQLSVHRLTPARRRVLAVLALFGGAFLPTGLVSVISNSGQVAEALAGLRDRALVDQADDRFGLPACQTEGYRELFFRNVDLAAAVRDVVGWLSSRHPGGEESLSAVNAVLSLIGFAAERQQWHAVVRLVRVAEPILTLAGRWETCAHLLDMGGHAASATGDVAAEALFQHQLGTLDLCREQLETAQWHLSRALELRRGLNDLTAVMVTEHNLRLASGRRVVSGRHRRVAVIAAGALVALTVSIVAVATNAQNPSVVVSPGTGPTVTPTASPTPPNGSTPDTTGQPPDTTNPPPKSTSATVPNPLDLKPDLLPFGDVALGTRSLPMLLTITNLTNEPIMLAALKFTGDRGFSTRKSGCPSVTPLAPMNYCEVYLSFEPTTAGFSTGTVTVSGVGFDGLAAELTGTGIAPSTDPPTSNTR